MFIYFHLMLPIPKALKHALRLSNSSLIISRNQTFYQMNRLETGARNKGQSLGIIGITWQTQFPIGLLRTTLRS